MTNTFDRFNSWKGLIYSDKLATLADVLQNPSSPQGRIPYPVNWHIYATNACPYACNFCIMKEEKMRKGRLSRALLEKAVNDAARMNVRLIHFSGGGEPLAHPYISDAIRLASANGIKTALSTNGYLLNHLQHQVDHLRVSFNAGDPKTYKAIHGIDGFKRVIKNVREAVKRSKGKDIGLGFVLTHENYSSLDDFVSLAEDCGVQFVHIRPAYFPEYDREIRDAVKKIRPHSSTVDVFSVSDKFDGFWNDNKNPCRATPLHAVLSATGEFLVCQDRFDLRFGDYNSQSFDDIWFSEEHYDMLNKAQLCNIRCVECKLNEIIEHVFVRDSIRKDLL